MSTASDIVRMDVETVRPGLSLLEPERAFRFDGILATLDVVRLVAAARLAVRRSPAEPAE